MLTKPLVMHRLMAGLLADGSKTSGIVNNLTFALWITGIRLGDFGFWERKREKGLDGASLGYLGLLLRGTRLCLSGVLAFALSGYLPYRGLPCWVLPHLAL
jgi:hypothetical protein